MLHTLHLSAWWKETWRLHFDSSQGRFTRWRRWIACDVGEAKEGLGNELLILQPFRLFTYVTAHSPTLPSLYLRHSSFSSPSVVSPTSQLILKPLFRFTYVMGSSLTSLSELPLIACFRLYLTAVVAQSFGLKYEWERGLFLSWYMRLSGLMVRMPVRKLEIWGSNPSLDTNFSIDIYHIYEQFMYQNYNLII